MSKAKVRKIRQGVKEKELAKIRWQWFKECERCKNVSKVCRKHGIIRSVFCYWKKRIDLESNSGKKQTSKKKRLMSYSRKPKLEGIFICLEGCCSNRRGIRRFC